MKKSLHYLKRISLVVLASMLIGVSASAATFTAVASGNWSSTVTWGGTIPSLTNTIDQVTIPIGISVNMDNSVTLNGALASLTVNGTLTANAGTTLMTSIGTIAGTGVITTDHAVFGVNAVLTFTGSFTTNTMSNWALTLQSGANLMVNQTLTLATGTLSIIAGGTFSTAANATIIDSAGALTINGGTLSLVSNYNVIYNGSSISTGVELSGTSTLNNLTVAVSGLSTVTLMSHVTVNGTLTLSSGVLALNAFDLHVNGDVSGSGTGTISSTITSNISLHSTTGITGTLNFTGGLNSVNNLTIDVGTSFHARIHGTLLIHGTLSLTSGILVINSSDITINGNVSGIGMLSGDAMANLTITTTGGLSGGLSFDVSGQLLNNFNINVGSGNSVILSSNLNVAGTLSLTGGSNINISGVMLTLNGDLNGSGSFIVNTSSSLVLNASASLTSAVTFMGTIGNLTVNVGSLSTVRLGSHVTVSGLLTLSGGTLDLNSYDLTIMGDVSGSGTGVISSTVNSNVFVTTTMTITGALRFSSTNNNVNNFTVNIGGNGNVRLGTDLIVHGTLHFTSGTISTGSNTLHIAASGMITGASTTSYVITDAGGSLALFLTAGDTTGVIFHVGTLVRYYPARVVLNVGSNSGNIMVSAVDHVWANGTSGINLSTDQPLVDATWIFNTDITSNLNVNMWLMWSTSAEINGFDRTHAYISHYTLGAWDNTSISSAFAQGNLYAIGRMNITSFSPFAVFDQNTATGVPQVAKTNDFEIYPNPSSDYIFIKNSFSADDNVFVDVIDDFGKVVATHRITSDDAVISLNGLSAGNYILKVYNDKINTVTKKIVKL